MGSTIPEWFTEALAAPHEDLELEVRGATVRYRAWGEPADEVVVLIHGGAAHAGWWDHVAPHLAADRRVVAINLTGHGGSGTRDEYDFPTWADEVVAVAESAGGRRRYVIGHSMGGVAALTTAYRHVDRLDGTVLVDPPEWLVTEDGLPPRRLVLPPRRFHPDRATAAARFRARPPDPARLPFVEEYVAERSVHETSEGWTWRFDHEVTLHGGFPVELWGGPLGPMVVVLAERSLLSAEERAELVGRLGAGAVTIRDSGHHVMLDQPLALSACLEGILQGWRTAHSSGFPTRSAASRTL